MIQQLTISNYALIDRLDIEFQSGLTIITGETGAGKSILLGALGLILGQRADTGALQDKSKKCTIESVFNLKGLDLEPFFGFHDLDFSQLCTIRREINPEGKSRAFINDTPVNLQVLKELGENLIDIHSQHETLTLSDSEFQLAVLDAFAGNEILLREYKSLYILYRNLETRVRSLLEQEAASKRDLGYFQFQFTELEQARLDGIDQEQLESELEVLNNAEEIKKQLNHASLALNGGESNLLSSLNEVKTILTGLSRYNPSIASLSERLNGCFIEMKDIAYELESAGSGIVYDPAKVEDLNATLDAMYRLLQKHQVKTVKELVDVREELSNRLLGISSLETEIKAVSKELKELTQTLLQKAKALSKNRNQSKTVLEKELQQLLAQLGMPDASIQARCQALPEGEMNANGTDRLNFFFSANKGGELKELHKVASGGELSRLMLSIKSIIARRTSLPAVIFDEIDTGVSGDIADKVGAIMEQMAKGMQVVTITHLPQIASKGATHLYVYKEVSSDQTFTRIRSLKKEERIQEIAKMLSSGQPGPAALKNAKELLNS
jgi:DNA repair protein RecN (Recombination protein N)